MGCEVLWAIRGGGGESFGIVLSWRMRLVPVPPKVASFIVPVSVNDGAVDVLTKCQEVGPALPDDLFIRVLVTNGWASFQSLYLGTCDALLPVMGVLLRKAFVGPDKNTFVEAGRKSVASLCC
jgi:hypothetical protein